MLIILSLFVRNKLFITTLCLVDLVHNIILIPNVRMTIKNHSFGITNCIFHYATSDGVDMLTDSFPFFLFFKTVCTFCPKKKEK